jgi:carboxyl-terminal processing protease
MTSATTLYRSLAAACAFLTAGCALVDPHQVIGRQLIDPTVSPVDVVPSPAARALTTEGRQEAFDFVWQTVNERYHDRTLNGVDWKAAAEKYRPLALAARDDEAFWDVLDRMAGELKDSHTRVESPRRVELRKRDESVTLGFSFVPLEGKLAITSVHTDSDAWWAGVRPGMSLAKIGDEPAEAAYRRYLAETRLSSTDRARHMTALRRLLTGDLGTGVRLTFERADGSRIEGQFTRRRVVSRPFATHRILPSGYGYLRLSQWTVGVMPTVLEGVEALRNTPGLVIDLRGNPGGSVHAVNAMLSRFFTKKTDLGDVTTRTGRPVSLLFGTVEIIKLKQEVEGRPDAYKGPVVILVNAGSGSGSELFAGTMQAVGRATVVGEPSCGCLLGFLGYARVPGGAELAYSEVGFVMANGRKIEGMGVQPDRPVPLTLADLRAGRDRALEEAQAILATRMAAAQ